MVRDAAWGLGIGGAIPHEMVAVDLKPLWSDLDPYPLVGGRDKLGFLIYLWRGPPLFMPR